MSVSWLIQRNVRAFESDRKAVEWIARRIIQRGLIRASDGPNREQRKAVYRQAIEAQQAQREIWRMCN